MPDNLLLYLLLVAALGIGFLLGRHDWRRSRNSRGAAAYLSSIDQLLSERHSLDVDALVEAVVSQNDSVETRQALGASRVLLLTATRRTAEQNEAATVAQECNHEGRQPADDLPAAPPSVHGTSDSEREPRETAG